MKFIMLIPVFLAGMPAYAQSSPVPGAQYYASNQALKSPGSQSAGYTSAAPIPGAVSLNQYAGASNSGAYGASSPLPGSSAVYQSRPGGNANTAGTVGRSGVYQMLPISLDEAKLRIEELQNLVAINRPQDVQDKVYAFCEWLTDMTEAHKRLSNVFAKQDGLKAQGQSENSMAQKFAHLKNEATLLKADILIKQNRIPEAIGPLVDIVANEPKGDAGIAAYNRLKEIGFAVDMPEINAPITVGSTVQSAPSKPSGNPTVGQIQRGKTVAIKKAVLPASAKTISIH